VAARSCTVANAAQVAAQVRLAVPGGASVADSVRQIVAAVREGGDRALLEYEERFGGGGALKVSSDELAAALAAADPELRAGLEVAIENVRLVAEAGLDPEAEATLPQGHTVRLREVPVRRAAIYVPAGRNPYPSTVIMGAVTARAAGVDEVVVAAGEHPAILAAAALCEVDAVFRMGGAQAIAALAYGTETVPRADVIVGPGSLWVQEAKRQVSCDVGIDGFAGPSDLTVVLSAGADPEPLRADLLAQAEHGEGSLVVAVSDDPALLDRMPGETVQAEDMDAALAFAEALAPEHLQLAGEAAEGLAPRAHRNHRPPHG
jgi:histidinol dehydrogenase